MVGDRRTGLPNTRSATALRHAETADPVDEPHRCRLSLRLLKCPRALDRMAALLMLNSIANSQGIGLPNTKPKATTPLTLMPFSCIAQYVLHSVVVTRPRDTPPGTCTPDAPQEVMQRLALHLPGRPPTPSRLTCSPGPGHVYHAAPVPQCPWHWAKLRIICQVSLSV